MTIKKKLHSNLRFGLILLLLLANAIAHSASVEEFYQDKTLRLIVGFSPGGGYDTYARTIARYIGKHIPGNPDIIVQNMPGAGSLVAANYLLQKTKPDGLTLGMWHNALVLQQALGASKVQFDSRRFGWVGSPVKSFPSCAVMGFSGISTFAELLDSKRLIKMGAVRPGSNSYDTPAILNEMLGTHFDIVSGYKGTSKVRLAMQTGEVEGLCSGWESLRSTARSMLDANGDERLIPIIMQGDSQDPEVAHLPELRDFIQDPKKWAWFDIWLAIFQFQKSLTVTPGTSPERLEALREAFAATMTDPDFLADAGKVRLLIIPTSGTQVEQYVNTILSLPEDAKQGLQFLASIR